MKKKLIASTSEHFKTIFQHEPEALFLSPGRINIIGEHVDYNDGFVLPAAINKYICFAVSKSNSDECTLVAKDLNESYKFNWKDDLKPIDKMWVNYILGVLQQLKERGLPLEGFTIQQHYPNGSRAILFRCIRMRIWLCLKQTILFPFNQRRFG